MAIISTGKGMTGIPAWVNKPLREGRINDYADMARLLAPKSEEFANRMVERGLTGDVTPEFMSRLTEQLYKVFNRRGGVIKGSNTEAGSIFENTRMGELFNYLQEATKSKDSRPSIKGFEDFLSATNLDVMA